MKQPEDNRTLELALPKRRGRPFTGKARSNAQRQADFRRRRAFWQDVAADLVRHLVARA